MANELITPDKEIKNATIPKEELPAINSEKLGYFVRYRVVSKDKNRYSHWSPYYFLLKGKVQPVPCSVSITGTTTKALSLIWQHPKVAEGSSETSIFKEYHIYLRTNLTFDEDSSDPDNGFYYLGSSASTQFSTLLPTGISWFDFAIQVPIYPKTYNPDASVFTSAQTSL